MPGLSTKFKEIFGMTSFALSLLLVFRTNASYARWDEARKMWGMVLNRTRDICRLVSQWGAVHRSGGGRGGCQGGKGCRGSRCVQVPSVGATGAA